MPSMCRVAWRCVAHLAANSSSISVSSLTADLENATGACHYAACLYRTGLCRSPWNAADRYDPETLELAAPALPLEAATPVISVLESKFNEAFDTYRLMYFDGGISSVYLHVNGCDSDEHALASFTVTVLIKKTLDQEAEWDSIHVVECSESDSSKTWTYRSTSSIILHLASSALTEADFSVGGSLVEQVRALLFTTR